MSSVLPRPVGQAGRARPGDLTELPPPRQRSDDEPGIPDAPEPIDVQAVAAAFTFSFEQGLCVARWGQPTCVEIEVARIAQGRDELSGEVVVRSTVMGNRRQLAQRRVQLLGARAVPDLAAYCAKRRPEPDIDWHEVLEVTFVRAVEAYRAGEPVVSLDQVPERIGSRFVIDTLAYADLPTFAWARPGEGKTWILCGAAVALQTGRADIFGLEPARPMRVAILDYEDDAATKAERVRAIAGTPVPGIVYVACRRAIWDEADRIARVIREHGVEYLIVDSVGMACGGIPPESSEAALRYGTAVRELGLGTFAAAHIPKNTEDVSAPFGSQFWLAQLRLGWYVKREAETSASGFRLGLYQKKSNNTAGGVPPLGFDLTFADGRARFTRRDRALAEVPELASGLSVRWRLKHALAQGPRLVHEVAAEIDETTDTVARTLRRYAGRDFVRTPGAGGVDQWSNLRDSA